MAATRMGVELNAKFLRTSILTLLVGGVRCLQLRN